MALTPEQARAYREELEQIKALGEEITEEDKQRAILLENALANLGRALEQKAESLRLAKEELNTLKDMLGEEDNKYIRIQRQKALNDAILDTRLQELKYLQDLVAAGKELEDDQKERLEDLEKAEVQIRRMQDAQSKVNDLTRAGSDMWQSQLLSATAVFSKLKSDGKIISALGNQLDRLAQRGLTSVLSKAKELIFSFDKLTVQFQKQFQVGEAYTQSIQNQFKALNDYGVSLEEAVEAQANLISTYTDFTMLGQQNRDMLAESSAVLGRLGVAQSDFARGIQNSTKFFGQSVDTAETAQREIVAVARELGVAPGEMSAQFAQAGGALAKFGRDGIKVFKDMARIQKISGMEMEKVLAITNRFDTFEGAAEQTGKLNAALGGNFVNAMDLMMETDPAARFESIRDSILDAGLTFDDMSYYQKQFYTEALGLSDVGDLALMLSGNMDMLAGATNKSAEELMNEKEKALELTTAQERMTIIGVQMAEAFLPLVKIMQGLTKFMADYADVIKFVLPLMAAFKVASIGLAIAKSIEAVATIGLGAAEAATGKRRAGAIVGILLLAGAIGWLASNLMIESPSKVVLALFGVAAGMYAIDKVGTKSAGGMQKVAASATSIGLAIFLVTGGLALMAAAFSLLSTEQLIGLGAALVGVGVGIYFLTPSLTALGGAALAVSPGLAVISGLILSIGAAIGMAAAGVGVMASGFGDMFESLDLKKMISFVGFVGAMIIGAPYFVIAGIGLGVMALGLGALALSLNFIATKDLEAIALFASSLASVETAQMKALAGAIREVAAAMDDIPTTKAMLLNATITASTIATKTMQAMGGSTSTTATNKNTGGFAKAKAEPINVNVTLELDGEVLERKIIRVTRDQQSSGGSFSVIDQLMNR